MHAPALSELAFADGKEPMAKTAFQRRFDAFDRLVVPAFQANREVVVLALPIHVNGKCQILAWLKQVNFFFEQ